MKEKNDKQECENKRFYNTLSIFSYIALLTFPLSTLYMFIITKLNKWFGILRGSEGYGIGILVIIGIIISIFIGVPAFILNIIRNDKIRKKQNIESVLLVQIILVLPCIIYWVCAILLVLTN